jgi:hypothetical protein
MRRSLLGLLTVVATAGLLITAGCQRSATLRVTSINGGNALRVDLSDFYVYFDKVDSEDVTLVQTNPDSIKVELQYVEIGAGLPTWTPYEALIDQATVKVTKSRSSEDIPYSVVKIPMNLAVQADASGKTRTSFWITAIPAWWTQSVFGDAGAGLMNVDDKNYTDVVDLTDVSITFSGYDSVANRSVGAVGEFQVEFGNFYDDPTRFGR